MYTYNEQKANDYNAYVAQAWAYIRGERTDAPAYSTNSLKPYRDGYDFDEIGFIGQYVIPRAFERYIGWNGKAGRCPIWDNIQECY